MPAVHVGPLCNYRILKRGGGSRGQGTREAWGTLGKLREYKAILEIY